MSSASVNNATMGLLPDTQNYMARMGRGCRERFSRHRIQRKTLVNHPGMHHGTCVTHVPWGMSGSLTCGCRVNVPGIAGVCATRNFTYLVRGPLVGLSPVRHQAIVRKMLAYCWLDHWYLVKIVFVFKDFHQIKRIWKCRLPNGGHLPRPQCVKWHLHTNKHGIGSLWASWQIRKIAGCACAGNAGTFSRPSRVRNPTCMTYVSWCMPGSLKRCFLWSRWRGQLPCIPGACATPQCYVSGKRSMIYTFMPSQYIVNSY